MNEAIEENYAIKMIDEASDTITYIGLSELSNPVSIVKKIEIIGSVTSVLYASGLWENRATLTYK